MDLQHIISLNLVTLILILVFVSVQCLVQLKM